MMFYFMVAFTFTNGSQNRSRCCTKLLSITKVCFILVASLPTVMAAGGAGNVNGHSVPNIFAGGAAIVAGCLQMAQLNLLQINMNFLQQRNFEYCTLLTQSVMFPLAPSKKCTSKLRGEKWHASCNNTLTW